MKNYTNYLIAVLVVMLMGCNAASKTFPHEIVIRNTNKFAQLAFYTTNAVKKLNFNDVVVLYDSMPFGLYAIDNNKLSTDTLIFNHTFLIKEILIKNIDSNRVVKTMVKLYNDETVEYAKFNKDIIIYLDDVAYEGKGFIFLITAIFLIISAGVIIYISGSRNAKSLKIPTDKVASKMELN